MTDTQEEEIVRRMKRRSFGPLVAVAVVLVVLLVIAVLLWPIAKQPAPSKTLPQMLGDESAEVYNLPTDDSSEQLLPWVEAFKAQWDIPSGPPERVRDIAAQTVALMYTSSGGYQASGFVLRPGIVISAAHLLDVGMSGARVYVDCGGGPVEAEVITSDRIRDVLVIAAPHCDGQALRLHTRRLRSKDVLYKTGFTFQRPSSDGIRAVRYVSSTSPLPQADKDPAECRDCSLGYKNAVRRAGVAPLRAITGAAIKGHSGSPVLFESGALAGMIVQLDGDHPRAYMVSAYSISRTLRHVGLY